MDKLYWTIGITGGVLVAIWLIYNGLNRFFDWQTRLRNKPILAQAVREAHVVAADAWERGSGNGVRV